MYANGILVLLAALATATPLPEHPDVVAGALENGVRYQVKTHPQPPGRVSLRLHLPVGSFNEDDDELGYAHLLEHLAFAGSENFPDGSVVPHFESLGLTVGRHHNAFTGFDQTVYSLDLPDAGDDTVGDGLTFFADVLGRLHLPEERVVQERAVVLAEFQTWLGPQQRLIEQLFPRVSAGARAAERPVLGDPDALRSVERAGPERFYRRWYTTGAATVVVVGDIEVERARALIDAAFGDLEGAPAPPPADPGAVAHDEAFAVVATDEDAVGAEVTLLYVSEDRGPTRTVEALRRDLAEAIAVFAFNRRLTDLIADGVVAFRGGGAATGSFFGAGWSTSVSVSGDADAWQRMLAEAAGELQRFRAFGVGEREMDDARAALLAAVRQYARIEPAMPAAQVARTLVSGVHDGDTLMSGAQWLALAEQLAPGIGVDEVSAVFRRGFDPERMVVMLTTEHGEHTPTEDDVLVAAVDAFAAETAAGEDRGESADLPDIDAEPGAVADDAFDDANEVYSAWLTNGVRVHHRFMDRDPTQFAIQVTLAGGVIEETEDTRAHTAAAVGAWQRLATRRMASADIRSLLAARMLFADADFSDDAVTLWLAGTDDDLADALRLLHLLLTEPRVEQVAFEQWRRAMLQGLQASERDSSAQLSRLIQTARYPDTDPRWLPLTAADIERLEHASVQGWLDALVRRAPVEVAIVGDVAREDVMALVDRFVGSLPSRARIGPSLFDRDVTPPRGPLEAVRAIPSATPQAAVLVGFASADDADLDDLRALNQAGRILRLRMNRRIREQEGLVYSISAGHIPSPLPGFAAFTSGATTEPAKADRLAAVITEMFADFADDGPTADEVDVAFRQFENGLREAVEDPAYWLGRYGRAAYRGRPVYPMDALLDAYRALTAERIRDAFARYHEAGNTLRFIVVPDS